MPVAYLTAAVLSGAMMTMLWIYSGGGWWYGALVYILSGNLVLWGLILREALWSGHTTAEGRIAAASERENGATQGCR